MSKKGDQGDNVVLGVPLPSSLRRQLPALPKGLSGIDLQLARLSKLHSNLEVKFRTEDLAEMTAAEKALLLADVLSLLNE